MNINLKEIWLMFLILSVIWVGIYSAYKWVVTKKEVAKTQDVMTDIMFGW